MADYWEVRSGRMTNINGRPVYWECKDNSSAKFWAAKILKEGKRFILARRWGKIDTKGQSMKTEFNDIYEAERQLDKLIWGKESKGYKPLF